MPKPHNTPNNPLLQFAYTKTRREHRKQKWANSLYKRLTKRTLQLYVPAHNWGGAFIKSADNEYDDALLAGKDRYSAFDPKNYDIFDVQVEPATEKLGQLFNDLHTRGARNGTIKIDVEGYEKQVLTAIATALPAGLSTYIVFENWKDGLDLSDVLARTTAQARLYLLDEHKPGFFSRLRSRTTLLPVDTASAAGTYILHLQHA